MPKHSSTKMFPEIHPPIYLRQAPSYGGDGSGFFGPSVELNYPTGVAFDTTNQILYIADYVNHRIRAINGYSDIITTFAGKGTAGFSGDGGPATGAQLYNPTGVAVFLPSGLPPA